MSLSGESGDGDDNPVLQPLCSTECLIYLAVSLRVQMTPPPRCHRGLREMPSSNGISGTARGLFITSES